VILLTGGRGLLGFAIAASLSKHHLAYCATTTQVPAEHPFVSCNLLNPEAYPSGNEPWDAVIHCATHLQGGGTYAKNMRMTENVIAFSKKHPVKKLIFISSSNASVPLQDEYSRSKKDSEKMIRESGLEYCIIRPTIMFSERDKKNIFKMMQLLKTFHVAMIPGNGEYRLQPVWVDDVADLTVQCLLKWDLAKNQVLAIGGGETLEFKEMIRRMGSALSAFYIPVYMPLPLLDLVARDAIRSFVTEKIMDNSAIESKFNVHPRTLSSWLEEFRLVDKKQAS